MSHSPFKNTITPVALFALAAGLFKSGAGAGTGGFRWPRLYGAGYAHQ